MNPHFNNEELEMELKAYEKKLEKEQKVYKGLKQKLQKITKDIKEYEEIIEDNRFLFQNKQNHLKVKAVNLNQEEGIDQHTQSLLKMMQEKNKKLEQKLQEKELQF